MIPPLTLQDQWQHSFEREVAVGHRRLVQLSPTTDGDRAKEAESHQSPISCRGCSEEFLKFDITKSQLVVYWSKCHPETEPLGALVVAHW